MNNNRIWSTLEKGLGDIYEHKSNLTILRYAELQSNVYNYCTNIVREPQLFRTSFSDVENGEYTGGIQDICYQLYSNIRTFLQNYITRLIENTVNVMDMDMIFFYMKTWTEYQLSTQIAHHILSYMNRNYIRREIDEKSTTIFEIYELGILVWRNNFFQKYEPQLLAILLELIERERNGERIDGILIKNTLTTYTALSVRTDPIALWTYKTYFEVPFIKATEQFYNRECDKFMLDITNQYTFSGYLKLVERRLQEETNRVSAYLHISSEILLIETCERILILTQMDTFLKYFEIFLDGNNIDDLKRLYCLVRRITPDVGLDKLKEHFREYTCKKSLEEIRNYGSKIEKDAKVYINVILGIHKKYTHLITEAFQHDAKFVAELDQSFQKFVNSNYVTEASGYVDMSSLMLATFCDASLKKSSKNISDDEIEEVLNGALIVFKYIVNKDAFEVAYRKLLQQRLIRQTSVSDYAEELMLSKLKAYIGNTYIRFLEQMFIDRAISNDLAEQFREYKKRFPVASNSKITFNVHVLKTVETSMTLDRDAQVVTIPLEILGLQQQFVQFYNSIHTGRTLLWNYNIGSKGEIQTSYLKIPYTLKVSAHQIVMLLLFNDTRKSVWYVEEIVKATSIKTDAVLDNLAIFLKLNILHLNNGSGAKAAIFNDRSGVTLNMTFESNRNRINCDLHIKVEQKKVLKTETDYEIQVKRGMIIESGIMRVLKTKKTIQHKELITAVIGHVKSKFKPEVAKIKKCIESLIERDFIERDPKQADLYHYPSD